MLRGRPLDRRRKNDNGDKLNADSNKRSDERVGIHGGEVESARREARGNERARDGVRAEGKDQWEAAAVLAGSGDEN